MPAQARSVVVHKFGGAALADAGAIASVVRLLALDRTGTRRVVAASALMGVTDALASMTTLAAAGDLDGALDAARALRSRHLDVATDLMLDAPAVTETIDASFEDLERLLDNVAGARELSPRTRDDVLARGERLSALILSAALDRAGIASTVADAQAFLHTDGRAGNAAPDLARTDLSARAALEPLLDKGFLVVVPGFIGSGKDGEIVTLGRGGTDLTATVLARALEASEVTLWKDVAGCMTADPRLVPDARVVPLLDAREASELAYYGAKVLHPRTLVPLQAGTILRIRPFADPEAAGTTIVPGRPAGGSPVRALSAILKQALVTVQGNGMIGVPGVAARTFGALANTGVSVSMISQASSEHSICFTVPETEAARAVAALREAFSEEISRNEVDDIELMTGLATIAVVGSGMVHTPGIASRIFGAVAGAEANVVAIAQGASERIVSFVVDGGQAPAALRAVHSAFHLHKVGGGKVGRRARGTDIILLGFGRVGRELVSQVSALARDGRAPVRVVGLIDKASYVFDARGLSQRRLASLSLHKQKGGTLGDVRGGEWGDAREAVDYMGGHSLMRPVLVDVASGDTAPALLAAIAHDMDLVLANKVPLAGDIFSARAILQDARARGRRVLHEATVGAGLPVIDTLQQLLASGDRVHSVEGCPSGTMGYLFSEMARGKSFSTAVRDAMALGYTEPDPREDLCGLDVARKGLILGRLLGYAGELTDVAVESLVPEALRSVTKDEFLEALPSIDERWAGLVKDARDRGEVLRYRARATRGGVRVGLVGVPIGSALGSLDGTDNLFVFTTARYRERPLVVSGPGAGAEVTAAGVLGDLLRMVAA
ncbi:MAG TPA: aspartate kinase [Gemmatimonadaceae bacterium]|nr:aspartate kinase [Gemmatimonadaceae bacterium]